MSAPAVSVVIPTKDRRDLCRLAVESCLTGHDAPLEVIVVDDGSTDGTAEALAGLPIRYVRQEWAGRSAARNRGVALSSAPVVAFLDSDDVCLPGRFDRQLAGMHDAQVGSWGQVELITEADALLADRTAAIQQEIRETAARGATPPRLAVRMRIYPSTVLVRRAVFDEVGGFDEGLYVAEDVEWLLRLTRRGQLAFEPEPVVQIRQHAGNSSSERMFQEAVQFTAELASAAAGAGDRAYRARLHYYRARALWSLGENRTARSAGWTALHEDPSVAFEPGFLKRQLLSLLPARAVNRLRPGLRAQDSTKPSNSARQSGV